MGKLGDVLGVSGLQHRVLKHPELLSCISRKRVRKQIRRRTSNRGDYHTGGQKTPKRTEHTAGNNLLRCITVFDADTVERGNRNGDKLPLPLLRSALGTFWRWQTELVTAQL